MSNQDRITQALQTLENYIKNLSFAAGESEDYAKDLWQRIRNSSGVLQELAYYHDYGRFLCRHQVAGYTFADILVWQVDHFKAYLDRHEEVNRYRQEKLFLTSLDIMLQMEKNPQVYVQKMSSETGTDYVDKYPS